MGPCSVAADSPGGTVRPVEVVDGAAVVRSAYWTLTVS